MNRYLYDIFQTSGKNHCSDLTIALAMLQSLPEPGKYQASIDVLEEKSRKLQKRRQEAKAHQRNVRKGKK